MEALQVASSYVQSDLSTPASLSPQEEEQMEEEDTRSNDQESTIVKRERLEAMAEKLLLLGSSFKKIKLD